MCPACYDYQAAVLFNACAADLWRRFTTYLPRQLARRLGMTQKDLRALARIRFVKVAEYQARGVVHFHAVIRLDAPGEDYQAPLPGITAEALCEAIGLAAAAVAVVIEHQDQAVRLGFGAQTDTRIIRHGTDLPGTGQALNGVAVANYIAKYATKTLSAPGVPSSGYGAKPTLNACAAPRTTGGSSPPPGSSAPDAGPGRTCSATAATS
jgi:hypothetical protein